jgi:hypothetical protein
MSQDDVLTLIRLARKYPQVSDALLAAAERIGTNGVTPTPVVTRESYDAGIPFPLEIFCIYKGQTYRGKLSRDRTVTVNGRTFDKPSPAAMSITNNSVNGWRWWWYKDPRSGQSRQIDDLKKRGLL